MSTKPLIQLKRAEFQGYPTSLRSTSVEVENLDDIFRARLSDLLDTFEAHKIAVGLSAPQIGINERFFVINPEKTKGRKHSVFVNPKCEAASVEREERYESCMSLPGVKGNVSRHLWVTVSYQDEFGERHRAKFEGFRARIIQHEMDHLDGILFVDRMIQPPVLEETDIFNSD